MTAIRPLPSGWRWMKLGDVAEYINGRAFKPEDWVTIGLPIVRIQNLTSSEAVFNYYGGPVDSGNALSDGDLLVSWSATLDVHWWTRGPAVLNQHIFKVVERPSVARRDYLFYAFKMVMASIRSQVHGATMRHITKPDFEATMLPLPPLPEQRRIVGILNEQMQEVEKARKATEAQLAAARSLPAAYLREVFDSDEAKKWPRVKLGELCDFVGGMQPPKSTFRYAPTPGYVRLIQIQDYRTNSYAVYIREQDSERRCSEQDIMIARYGGGGDTSSLFRILRGLAGAYNVALMKLVPVAGKVLVDYLYYALQVPSLRKEIVAKSARAIQSGFTKGDVSGLAVPIPTPRVQEAIAARLREAAAQTEAVLVVIDAHAKLIDRLPAALLRKAFAGQL
jgi:type I restriction enzyme, S subunit